MYQKLLHLSPNTKHLIHCVVLNSLIAYYVYKFTCTQIKSQITGEDLDPFEEYGATWTYLLYFFRILIFLVFPQCLFNYFGLTCYNAFINTVELKGSPMTAPFICFRVVTRGDYPDLVKSNLRRNLKTCFDVGLMDNFIFEIATDKELNLLEYADNKKVREILIPSDYQTRTGALFKVSFFKNNFLVQFHKTNFFLFSQSRALQYCLEDNVNQLGKSDWIVHLDEETLLTENSVRGIINFVLKNKHEFGQGVITYANEEIRNWITTLADSFRVTEDFGKLRFQFLMFHRPIFGWKGKF